MQTSGAVLVGAQRPPDGYWTAPDRHRDPEPGCPACQARVYDTGCGNYVARECLSWADNYWNLDEWQDWYLTEGLGVKPNGRFSATDVAGIIPRQNGKGTCLEVRELAGLFVLNEKRIIHTAHQFSTAVLHFDRIMEVFDAHPELSKWLKTSPKRAHGFESIELIPKPTLIFAANGKMVRESFSRKLEFHARTGKKSRGFTCNCLVWDEAMYLTGEQVGAARPTLRSVANHQVWVMGSAGMKESLELAGYHEGIIDGTKRFFGAEWGGLKLHNASCPRDKINGRKTNDYVVNCTAHMDRDIPAAWAASNPAYGIRVEEETFRNELEQIRDVTEANRELLNVGEWPERDEVWAVINKERWEQLIVDKAGTVPPVAIAVDVDEDSKSASIGVCWQTPDKRLIVKNPDGFVFDSTDDLLPELEKLYTMIRKNFGRVVAIVVPKDGPAAGIGDSIEKRYRNLVVRSTSQDHGAAFAFFVQKVSDGTIGHPSRQYCEELYSALGGAETRLMGDGGKTWKRRDATVKVSPVTTCCLAAWIFNKMRNNYNLLNSIG
jgi:hypothetical protein